MSRQQISDEEFVAMLQAEEYTGDIEDTGPTDTTVATEPSSVKTQIVLTSNEADDHSKVEQNNAEQRERLQRALPSSSRPNDSPTVPPLSPSTPGFGEEVTSGPGNSLPSQPIQYPFRTPVPSQPEWPR